MEQEITIGAVGVLVGGGVRHILLGRSPEIIKIAVAGGELIGACALAAVNPSLAPVFWGVLLGNVVDMAISRR